MIRSIVLCALLLFPSGANAEELPEPFFGIASGGHYCETEEQMLSYLGLRDLVELGELAPFDGFPPGCGELPIGEPLYYEPVRWVEYTSAHVLLGRVTNREMKVSYVYMNVRIKPDA